MLRQLGYDPHANPPNYGRVSHHLLRLLIWPLFVAYSRETRRASGEEDRRSASEQRAVVQKGGDGR